MVLEIMRCELQLQGRIHEIEHRRLPKVPRSEKGLSFFIALDTKIRAIDLKNEL